MSDGTPRDGEEAWSVPAELLAQDPSPENDRVVRLLRGNTVLIEALMDMVNQFFLHRNENGAATTMEEDYIYHSFMSAEEGAIAALIEAGYARMVPGKGYLLLWDRLKARMDAVEAAQKATMGESK